LKSYFYKKKISTKNVELSMWVWVVWEKCGKNMEKNYVGEIVEKMWKTITWEKCGKFVKRIVWKKCGKEYCEKSVENMWKIITWENCGKAVEKYVEKNRVGKWKTITHRKSVERL